MRLLFVFFFVLSWISVNGQSTLFKAVQAEQTNVRFTNEIKEDAKTNIMIYDYLYNGGGVGVGDFDKNGFPDVFFAGNMVEDQLYFNQGNLRFEEVTKSAGISKNGWSSGVCVFDVNGDGWDDIYVLRSGPPSFDDQLNNVLYVNQQDGTFKEEAARYGLNLQGHHTQAAPLDIDLDGDLDLYIMGHPGSFKHKLNFQDVLKEIQSGRVESDILLENIGGQYIDITKDAGIVEYGYGLGLAITDINQDRYPDIIVCNDFDEPDHVFVNQQNNTFVDQNLSYFKHTTNYSMGNDVADINNDGLQDYISVDMAFEDHERSKMNMASMDPQKFYARVQLGWGYQYMHNMLHLNTGMGSFQEVAQFAGVAKTDWSWAPLFFDMDMDGLKDLFISNGYKRDTKNNDIGFMLAEAKEKKGELTIEEFLELIPSVRIENFFFKNKDGLKFEDQRADWGVDEKLNSNGAAFADLDLDGDLDLILNNVDTLASIYENTSPVQEIRLVIDLKDYPQAKIMGAKFTAISEENQQFHEAYFVRGYCSTVEKKISFYDSSPFLKLQIQLPNGECFERSIEKYETEMTLDPKLRDFKKLNPSPKGDSLSFHIGEITEDFKLDAVYLDNKYNDFEKESLLPHMMSTMGPEIEVSDFDNNGLEDFIVTSAVGNIPTVFLQNSNRTFKKLSSRSFYNHQGSEEADIKAFDVNGDKNLDLIMSSGGYQYPENDTALENRLYIGNGLGMFGLVENAMLHKDLTNSGKIVSEDIDKDGDFDFLICGRGYPAKYPYAGKTKIYRNDKGYFKDVTKQIAPSIEYLGIVNDACFSDVDGDGDRDILFVGEWMQIEYAENTGGGFVHHPNKIGRAGWWTCITPYDIDGDGDEDFVLGNAGMNNKFKASAERPLEVYANDFDDNGSLDIVLAYDKGGYQLPVRGRECSSSQMPFLSHKFPTFLSFASSNLEEIYGKEKLDRSLHYTATEFRNGVLYNNGKEGFLFSAFPDMAQLSFINAYLIMDLNGDDLPDIIGVGNRYNTEVETSRYDAGCGVILIQQKDGTFEYVEPKESGFYAPHNAKSMAFIKIGASEKPGIIVGNNRERLQLFEIDRP